MRPRLQGMTFRRIAALAVILTLGCLPARAQEQSFAAFEAALWPDAQAKGITRATFDLALKGVTPDPRVIAATKRQPEYGKPVGAYVNDAVSRGRIANGQRKAQGMGEDLRRGGKEIRRRALGADRAVGHGNRLRRREGPLGRVPLARHARLRALPASLFPQRVARRHAHHAGQQVPAREDGQFMGRRHGADPVHADQRGRLRRSISPATAKAISGAMCRTCSARPPIISPRNTG